MKSTLNSELLASMLKSKRGKKGLRDTATEIGEISSATLSRVEQGNLPDVETLSGFVNGWESLPILLLMEKKSNKQTFQKKTNWFTS